MIPLLSDKLKAKSKQKDGTNDNRYTNLFPSSNVSKLVLKPNMIIEPKSPNTKLSKITNIWALDSLLKYKLIA